MPLLVAANSKLGSRPASSISRLRSALPVGLAVPPRYLASLVLLSAIVGVLAACGTQPGAVLPRKAAALAAPATGTRPGLTPRQQVIAAYVGYWQAYGAAMSSQNAARAAAILAPYDEPGAVPRAVMADRLVWAAHETGYGSAVTHILSVRVAGNRALLHDCLDLSHFGAQDTRTGRVVPESFGLPRLNFYITLVLSGGRWLVTDMQPVVVPCKP
jgi:hypothetical protein